MKRLLAGLICSAALVLSTVVPTIAQNTAEPVRIGVLTDLRGPIAVYTGSGSVVAARMAAADFGGRVRGRPIEILSADHQNKADIGSSIAREWIDVQKVMAIVDVPNSSVALAVQNVARGRAITLFSGGGSSELTDGSCANTSFQWTYNSYATARANAKATLSAGIDTWFFITADYAFGLALQKDAGDLIERSGGKIVGSVRHPLSVTDYASPLLMAQSSGAKAIALANAGADTINAIKQAAEFGIGRKSQQRLVGLTTNFRDVESMGLEVAQGSTTAESFYWDLDDKTREWSARFKAATGQMPTNFQAGVYSAVLHYLKALDRASSDNPVGVGESIRALPVQDFMSHAIPVRADGQVMRDINLFTVKSPAESKGPGDFYKLTATVKAEDAFRAPSESRCNLLK